MMERKIHYHLKRVHNREEFILESHVFGLGMFGTPTTFVNYICGGTYEECIRVKDRLEKMQ